MLPVVILAPTVLTVYQQLETVRTVMQDKNHQAISVSPVPLFSTLQGFWHVQIAQGLALHAIQVMEIVSLATLEKNLTN